MKSLLIFSFVLCFSFLYCQNLEEGLLLHYPFSGDALDASGNNFHGIPNATLTEDRFGNVNSAYSFNGLDEYIDFPIDERLKPELPFSFSFWVKFDDLQSENSAVFTSDYVENLYSGAWLSSNSDSTIGISFGDSGLPGSISRRTKFGTTKIETNTWYHIAIVFQDALSMEIFVDCVNDAGTYSGSGGNLAYTENAGSLGRIDASNLRPPYYFKGSIDEFYFWNRALTQSDVDSLCEEKLVNVKELTLKDQFIRVFPNPTKDFINIESNYKDLSSIIIFNSLGAVMVDRPYSNKIDVSTLPKVIYHISILGTDGKVASTEKILVND